MPIITFPLGFISSFEKANVCFSEATSFCVLWQIICVALLNPLKEETLAFCLPSRGRRVYHRSSVSIHFGDGRECLELSFSQYPSLLLAENTRNILASDISQIQTYKHFKDLW